MNKVQKKTHALLIGNFSNRTGYAWRNIYRLYNVIARELHCNDVGVCVSFASISPPITIIDDEIPVQSFCYDPINVAPSGVIRLIKNIKKYNIKYVYATDLKSYHWSYPLLRLAGVKYIVLHNRVSVANPYPVKPETGMKRLIKSLLARIEYINANKIYCVSDFTKHRLVNKSCVPEGRIIRILNGINIDRFICPDKSTEGMVMIFAGARATLHKGIQVLIEAANILLNVFKVENFNIHYAGNGPDMEYLISLVQQYNLENYFQFLGEVAGTQEYVCASDIVVVPSVWGDACPSAVSEALAAGKPLITTKAGGIPEIVGSEANAVLVEPGDAKALAARLNDLIKDAELRARYGKNARLRAESALDEKIYYSTVISQIKLDFKFTK